MGNKNYQKGAKKEQRIANKLKKEGWDVAQRTAGSHGPFDVIAINKKTKTIKLIQSKPKKFSQLNIDRLMEKHGWMNGEFKVEFEIK